MTRAPGLFVVAAFAPLVAVAAPVAAAPPTWPAAREAWHDDFEGAGPSDLWEDYGEGRIRVTAVAARPPSAAGLAVDVSGSRQTYLQMYHLTPWPHLEFPRDTYFRFSFHPNGVSIPAGGDIALVRMRDGDWNVMVGLRLRREGSIYSVVLELPGGALDDMPMALTDDWHTIVVGIRMHDWVGVWVDDDRPRVVEGVAHAADFVQVLLVGKPDGNWSGPTPSGTVLFDDAALLFAAYHDLWVDANAGDDGNEGTTSDAPLATIGRAAVLASAGTTVHVGPGDYREAVVVPTDGEAARPLRFVATGGRGTARILGSNPASSVAWTRLTDPAEIDLPTGVDPATATIWKADLSAWGLANAPAFVVTRGADGAIARLLRAREPDFRVDTAWKHHEFWWAAEGGRAVTMCDPAAEPDCDGPQRSDRWLLDFHDDPEPEGIEPGSLASLGDVTGAIVHVKDNWSGHYTFRRRVAETPEPGRVRLEALPEGYTEGCWFDHDPDNPALGWHSKYYIEGLAKFLDTPGEWFFDEATGTIHIWTPDGRSPGEAGVEISVRDTGVTLSHRSYVEMVDLDVLLFEEQAIRISNSDRRADRSYGIALRGLDLGWSTRGLFVGQAPVRGSPAGSQIRRLVLRDSRIHDIDSLAIFTWAGHGRDWVRPGITDFLVVHNEFARIGFHDNEQGGGVGVSFHRADRLLFEGNHVHDIAHNGVQISQAQSVAGNRGYDLPPEEILTGDILVRGNLFERCVQNGADAAGLKFWGAVADRTHAFRDVLVVGNVSRNNVGWGWVSERRRNWTYAGKAGMGYYIDYAGGIHFFRNIAYENGLAGFMASGSWIDQGAVLANNTIVNSPLGYTMGIRGALSSSNVGLQVANTIFVHLRRFALGVGDPRILRGRVAVDHDLFHLVGYEPWPGHSPGILGGRVGDGGYHEYATLAEVQAALGIEAHGAEGDPAFAAFDPAVADGSWQDFRLTPASDPAIDTGADLPGSLVALLAKFRIDDGRRGAALDRGAIEFDPADPAASYAIDVGPTDGSAPIVAPWADDELPPGVPAARQPQPSPPPDEHEQRGPEGVSVQVPPPNPAARQLSPHREGGSHRSSPPSGAPSASSAASSGASSTISSSPSPASPPPTQGPAGGLLL
ncbi:MAG: DUF1565 domain-containing protein [Myxococcota bacterium]|nr:DUF1565 domain-containing protein [Myxococcota bacterium]